MPRQSNHNQCDFYIDERVIMTSGVVTMWWCDITYSQHIYNEWLHNISFIQQKKYLMSSCLVWCTPKITVVPYDAWMRFFIDWPGSTSQESLFITPKCIFLSKLIVSNYIIGVVPIIILYVNASNEWSMLFEMNGVVYLVF